jgi:hypothetical protein
MTASFGRQPVRGGDRWKRSSSRHRPFTCSGQRFVGCRSHESRRAPQAPFETRRTLSAKGREPLHDDTLLLVSLTILTALIFDFTNGFTTAPMR